MQHQELILGMKDHLEHQLDLYRRMDSLQRDLLLKLDQADGMQSVLGLLDAKNALLDQVRSRQAGASALLDSWKQHKAELESSPQIAEVDQMINTMESLALSMRHQDEEMIRRFERLAKPADDAESRNKHSRNMLNAFRALR